jgi:D-lactate dehydrogenase
MKVAFFSFRSYESPFYKIQSDNIEVQFFSETLSFSNSLLAEGAEVISCFVNDKLDKAVIEKLAKSGLKLIALRCAGFNNVDLDAAKKAGISVVRVPAYSPYAVAEHAVALILSLNRKIHKAYNRVREGNFSLDGLTGFDLHGTTVGVIGTGKIGEAFCRIMEGFGCQVLASDPYPNPDLKGTSIQYVGMDELFKRSKIISLHLPLTKESHHLINGESLAKMQTGVMIINTSRGGLVDTTEVISGLKSGKIGALGLDVYEEEAGIFFIDHSEETIQDDRLARLMTFNNVLITSHQAFLTQNALQNIADATIDNVHRFSKGESLQSLVV